MPVVPEADGPQNRGPGSEASSYRGRFAPTPSGPLHFGSLVAAVGSYLQACAHGGQWRLRIDDLDTPRNDPGATGGILATLERFGFEWSGEVVYQSRRTTCYREALAALARTGASFPCACTRSMLGGGPYPGTCEHGLPGGRAGRSVRLRVPPGRIEFHDAVAGPCTRDVAAQAGPFVVLRADGIVAYHLATAVDEDALGITEVVRGADLLDSTPRQILVLRALGRPVPAYAHLPIAVDPSGEKLGKSTRAPPIDAAGTEQERTALLTRALTLLGHPPPREIGGSRELWRWARAAWRIGRVPCPRPPAAGPPHHDEPPNALC